MKTQLGIEETRFTINGTPVFLLGISYYGALGAPEASIRQDIAEMKAYGVNWLRVWATWAARQDEVSAVDSEGGPREAYLKKLEGLVAECDREGLAVDATLSRGNGLTGPARLQSLKAHRQAAEALASALASYRNWYLDIGNERNIPDDRFVSYTDLHVIRNSVRRADPGRLVTASHAGDIERSELAEYLINVPVDFLCPHRPRHVGSPGETEAKSKGYLAWMEAAGRVIPLHYQEPFRRDFGDWQPQAHDFATDMEAARAGGAAGWCFHNGDNRESPDRKPWRSFGMREERLFPQLDAEEPAFLKGLRRHT
ncbi:MAG: hypothetical protein IT210_17925 [Armatimonadetes bacterium]|nr:hypothetical protein [Armatimonadota bacterium]